MNLSRCSRLLSRAVFGRFAVFLFCLPSFSKRSMPVSLVFRESFSKAIADYTEAIRIDPDDALTYDARGIAYEELGDKVKAEADFVKAKELDSMP